MRATCHGLRGSAFARLRLTTVAASLLLGSLRTQAGEQTTSVPARKQEPVVLQLLWTHGFQFAGYYMAREKGYYGAAGFDVEFRERTMSMDALTEVVSGRAEYGVGACRIINDYLRGVPVVALAAVFQHSPRVIVATERSGIARVADLAGKRVAMPHPDNGPDIVKMLAWAGLHSRDLNGVPHEQSVDALIEDRADAQIGYVTYEPYELRSRGIPHRVFLPREYGVDFYGDVLYTMRERVVRQPERVWAFREASLRGWSYALENVEETIAVVLARHAPGQNRDRLLHEASEIRRLVDADLVAIGHMNPHRWLLAVPNEGFAAETRAQLLARVEKEFLFDDADAHPAWRRVRLLFYVVGLTACVALALLVAVCLLRVLVDRRTSDLDDVNRALREEIHARKAAEAFVEHQRDLATTLSESTAVSDCAEAILDVVLQLPGADCGGVYLVSETSQALELIAHRGIGPDFVRQYTTFRANSTYGAGALAGRSFRASHEDLAAVNDPFTVAEGLRAGMIAPVRHGSQVVASLHVASHSTTSFSQGVLAALESVALQVGGSIARLLSAATLRESEENFRRLSECAFDALVILSLEGRPVHANARAFAFLKYKPEDMGTMVFTDIVSPQSLSLVRSHFRARVEGRAAPNRYELDLRRSDGVDVPVDMGIQAMEWKGRSAWLYTFRDISERKRLEREVLSVAEWEKQRIAHNLHDSLGQQLVGAAYLVDALGLAVSKAAPQFVPAVDKIRESFAKAHQEVRQIVRGMLPAHEGESLPSCLTRLASDISGWLGIACVFSDGMEGITLPSETIAHLYHIAQESVTNAVRHGDARRVGISLRGDGENWVLEIHDNGQGFDPEMEPQGSGLRIMRYRADLLGGRLVIERRAAGGMRVACLFPVSG